MFPLTLQQVSVFKAMRGAFEKETPTSIKQMRHVEFPFGCSVFLLIATFDINRVFWYGILIFFVWELFPE